MNFTTRRIINLPDILRSGDCLVLNDTRVRACRLVEEQGTGDRGQGTEEDKQGRGAPRTEIMIVRILHETPDMLDVDAIVFPGRRFKPGRKLTVRGFDIEVLAETDIGRRLTVRVCTVAAAGGHAGVFDLWRAAASVPMPPYVRNLNIDPDRYQTCFAEPEGSVAAPTAGLHFTPALLETLERRGVELATLTLHVGPGTFRPVGDRELASGRLHSEPFELNETNAAIISRALAENRRVIAVGTTVCRTLESIALTHGSIVPSAGETDLFIRPGFGFRVISGLLTNFHLPRTSLLMLVAAFMGAAPMRAAYRYALESDFRFYSFGDAMLMFRQKAEGASREEKS